MGEAVLSLLATGGALALACLVTSYEQHVGRRVFLVSVRRWLDYLVDESYFFALWFNQRVNVNNLQLFIIALFQSLLRYSLQITYRLEQRIEVLQRRNQVVTKRIVTEQQTVLQEIALHKAEVALTEAEKRKLRKTSLG